MMARALKGPLALVLAVMMIFSGGGMLAFAAEGDTTVTGTPDPNPPELVSFSIDKTAVEPGGTVTVSATATDDISGVDYINAHFSNSENKRTYTVHFNEYDLKDGVYTDTIEISQHELDGTFQLQSITVGDNNDNSQTYYSKYSKYLQEDDLILPQEWSFTVTSSVPDGTPPVLTGFSIDKTAVNAPATITVSATATDDISGVDYINVHFSNSENKRTYTVHLNEYDLKNGVYTDTIEISQYELDGIFQLQSITVGDNNDNSQTYYSKYSKYLQEDDLILPQEWSFTVTSSVPDSMPPVLTGFSIDKTAVNAPATITVSATATDDISGVDYINAHFSNSENKRTYTVHFNEYDLKDGVYTDTIEISQYELDGIFQLQSITVGDNNDNSQTYYSKYSKYLQENDLILPQEISFTVNNNPSHVVTNTTNKNLANAIRTMDSGQTAAVSYEGNPHISADVFDALKGTDKKLVLEGDGIQWVFDGKDIESSKDLDLKVNISPLSRTPSSNASAIKNLVQNTPTMVLSFPNNGKLPGMALIRIKADYTFRRMLGTENLNVYYYDNTEKALKLISSNVSLTGDGWLEFSTDHNSDFIVTADTITNPEKPTQPGNSAGEEKQDKKEKDDGNQQAVKAALDAIRSGKPGKVQSYTTAAGATVPAVPVKLYGLDAALPVDAMETLAAGKTGLNVNLDNGAAGVLIPAGFRHTPEPNRLAYPLGLQKDPLYANLMKAAVKGDGAKTEVYKLGGGTLPTTATVTIKTKLTGKVNIYLWNEETRRATLIASPTAESGKVIFATKQLGNFILTTGTI